MTTPAAGTWKATVAASNKHGEGPESALSAEFTVGVTTKPTINSVQVGWWLPGDKCAFGRFVALSA